MENPAHWGLIRWEIDQAIYEYRVLSEEPDFVGESLTSYIFNRLLAIGVVKDEEPLGVFSYEEVKK